MEVNEAERIVIAKPIPSRPTCSNFRSFSELLASAINSLPPNNECSETTVIAIRPKTLRLKPMANLAPVGVVSQVTVFQIFSFSWTVFGSRNCRGICEGEGNVRNILFGCSFLWN